MDLKWKLLNEVDIFFVVVYQGILQMAYLDGLLSLVAKEFMHHVGQSFGNGLTIKSVTFDSDFQKCRQKADKELKESKRPSGMRSFAETKKGAEVKKNQEEKGISGSSSKKGRSGAGDDDDDKFERLEKVILRATKKMEGAGSKSKGDAGGSSMGQSGQSGQSGGGSDEGSE